MAVRFWGALYLGLAASIWGGMYVVSKVVLAVIPPFELVWIRYVVALAALVAASLLTKQSWRIRLRDLPLILVVGVIGYVISIWAQFEGTKLATAQLGSLITSATPAFMVLFAWILLKERITWKKGLSTILATCGVVLIVGVGEMSDAYKLGGWILGAAALTWALMSVLVKRIPVEYSQLVVTTYAILTAVVVMTPFTAGEIAALDWHDMQRPIVWGGVLYLGIVSTAGAFFLWNKGLQMMDAGSGGLYFFFQPLVGTLLGWLLLGEQVGLSFCIGALLIVGGVLLVVKEE